MTLLHTMVAMSFTHAQNHGIMFTQVEDIKSSTCIHIIYSPQYIMSRYRQCIGTYFKRPDMGSMLPPKKKDTPTPLNQEVFDSTSARRNCCHIQI